METSIDLYAEEYAHDYDDDNENQHEPDEQIENENQDEQIENENQDEQLEAEDTQEAKEDEDNEEKKKVKPKRIIKNPRPKLDVNALKSRKGLLCLEGYFKNKKYKGRGHEETDLRTIMKTYEYWCHRLFPKFPFDECLAKIEKLGTKKNVQTYINRIRMDLIVDEDQPIRSDNEEEQTREPNSDQFDNLLSQQDDINEVPTLTEEQQERIRLNREKANHLRLEKLQRAKERAELSLQRDVSSCNSQNDEIISNENGELGQVISPVALFDNESRENTLSSELISTSCEKTGRNLNETITAAANCEAQQSYGNTQECRDNTEPLTSIEEAME